MPALQIEAGDNVLLNTGVGFTVTTTFCDGPEQPFALVTYTYVTLMGALVVLVNVSLTFPVPVDATSVIPAIKARLQAYVAPTVALVAV